LISTFLFIFFYISCKTTFFKILSWSQFMSDFDDYFNQQKQNSM
jgi:hypothetical protein